MSIRTGLLFFSFIVAPCYLFAQDTTDIMSMLENEVMKETKADVNYATATFKTSRLVNGHTIENTAAGVLDVKISHRFGTLNGGFYELFGLDNASMRMGVDYGVTRWLTAGFGRSTYQKTYDGFLKFKLLRQSSGSRKMPISMNYVATMAMTTLKWADPNRKNFFSSRLYYTHQLLIASKLSEGTSIQIMPSFVHQNLALGADDPNDILAFGIGGRQKISKRVSINAEYYYQLPDYKIQGSTNSLSVGFDIETGGHVFQLHVTNSRGMTEHLFISQTDGQWSKGDILFGFNISRVFTVKRKH